jgi:hypothetical protein
MAGFFIPLFVGIAVYIWLGRRSRPSLWSALFDGAILMIAAMLSIGFWWREITGRVSQEIWLDEHGMLGVLIPMWVTAIFAPVLIAGAVLRHFLFSRVSGDASRAV